MTSVTSQQGPLARHCESEVATFDDVELLQRFESQSITRAQWTHRLHVRMAYLYLSRCPFPVAIELIRNGIQCLNAANQTPGKPNGYHETMTVAWATLVHTTILEQGAASTSDAFVDQHPHLLCSTLLRLFYSRSIWSEHDCANTFVAPDLTPLPMAKANSGRA